MNKINSKNRNQKLNGTLLLLLFGILFLQACNNKKAAENTAISNAINSIELTDAQLKNADLQTGKIEQRNIAALLKVSGKIDVPPQNMVSISVPLGGYLKATDLLPGMHINKGDVLAVMEDQQYIQLQQDFLTAKAALEYNEAEYNRQLALNANKATSDKIFQQTKTAFETQKIAVKSLEQKLQLIGLNPPKINTESISKSINLYSPITGFVSAVNVNIGKYVNPTDVLFELVNPTDIHLALNVFEKDIDKLSIGQKLMAYTNNNPDKKYPCEIILISKNLSTDRSVVVHCHFEKYDKTLIPGMFMNAEIEVQNHNATTLPSDAIVMYSGNQYVFIALSEKRFEMQEIQTANTENGFTQIIFPDGFDANSKTFVTKGAYTLLMKAKNTEE